LFEEVAAHVRLATAVLPFLTAVAFRLFAGKTRATSWVLTAALVWLVGSILLTPYSEGMRSDLRSLRRMLP
jgi:hypothetical protein